LLNVLGIFIKELIVECSTKNNFKIEEIEFDKDHIHLLISFQPTQSITYIISRIKQYSTYHIWRNQLYNNFLHQNFWKERTLWSDGYFTSSIGQANLSTIQEYIKNISVNKVNSDIRRIHPLD
jgi:putative transposase